MKNSIRSCLTALGLALSLATSAAAAATVETRFGALDGLGIGLASGDSFEYGNLINPQADGTNDWVGGGFTASLSISWSGSLTGASLQVFSGGWGFGGNAGVYLNNQLVGELTNGDSGGGDLSYAYLDALDLSAFLGLIVADNAVEIRTADPDDGGSLGYIKLILQTQDATGNTVPEPGSVALAGIAIASVLLTRRRRRD
ncbi:PEP-CTERM sorting domain-containing protein [Roseateles sp. P5_E7]